MSFVRPREVALLAPSLLFFSCSKPAPSTSTHAALPSSSAAEVFAPTPSAAPSAESPPAASENELPTVTAEQLLARIRASKVKGAIVNVWASWCGPCREELPMLQALGQNLKRDGIELLLVSVDEPEDVSKAVSFLKANEIHQPAFIAARPLGDFKVGMNPRWPGMVPATFLFDGQGKLHYFWGGPVYEKELYPTAQSFLAGTLVDGEADFTIAPGKVEK